ncbi:hypothetical protein AEA09_06935 [Lysinibacillus contaminans]|uniref:Uncharacterized protein n=1 Tax=Lysinibacillus contaminans TaxID=1293441 RepID=A0ABR5K0A8_9BACI|nr:hypothetical protein [Lysinibacillus contaminans]KOS68316.1 hypothetical protein AEA09_06935 [Lysinibacillus contaminans]
MFKKKIVIGRSEDIVLPIIEHLKKSNIPFEIGIKDILKHSSERFRSKKNDEIYEAFYTVEVLKKYTEQVEAIIAQYVSPEDMKRWYKLAKKKSRKLELKETKLFSFVSFLNCIALKFISIGKIDGADIFSYIACAVLLTSGVFMITKFYKEMQKESGILRQINTLLLIIGIWVIFYAASSFLYLLR